jgi:hypothetical protein
VQQLASLDGFFEGPSREIDWHIVDSAFNTFAVDTLETADVLIDEVRLILTPVFLGGGNTLFDGVKARHKLKLLSTRSFESGNVLVTYRPVRA